MTEQQPPADEREPEQPYSVFRRVTPADCRADYKSAAGQRTRANGTSRDPVSRPAH